MTRKTYHTVKVSLPGDSPDMIFLHHPDGRLAPDERPCEEIARAAQDKLGVDGIKEVNVVYTSEHTPGMWKTYEQIKRAVLGFVRRADVEFDSEWDVDVEVCHRITLYMD